MSGNTAIAYPEYGYADTADRYTYSDSTKLFPAEEREVEYRRSERAFTIYRTQESESQSHLFKIPDEAKFVLLRDAWYIERDEYGSIDEMVACPSYQKIIGMGNNALPLILNQLREEGEEPDFWFKALVSITCTNPVSPEHQGNLAKMAEAWLDWARRNGIT